MSKKSRKVSFRSPIGEEINCCKVEFITSVDERGQMVLPKDLRDKANNRAGDKLAIVSWDKGGEVCCLYIIKTEYLAEHVRDFLGPLVKEMIAS